MLAVLFALAVFGCKTPEKEPEKKEDPPKTLDQRLVGGRWYYSGNFDNPYSNGYYEFKDDLISILTDSVTTCYRIPVYSKNGIVYDKETDIILLHYEFHDDFPYANTDTHGLTSGLREFANHIAAKGDLITCTASYTYYNIYPDINYKWKFLVRFNEDGTPYQDYYK